MEEVLKICTKCKLEKGLEYYSRNKNGKLGLNPACKDCSNKKSRDHYYKTIEHQSERKKKYKKENKEKYNSYQRKYDLERRKIDPLYKLKKNIRTSVSTYIQRSGFAKKKSLISILGCTYDFFKEHIESKFLPWMNWENHGKYNGELDYGWDIDHIIPFSSANTEKEMLRLNHYTNLQPLCSKINRDIKKAK